MCPTLRPATTSLTDGCIVLHSGKYFCFESYSAVVALGVMVIETDPVLSFLPKWPLGKSQQNQTTKCSSSLSPAGGSRILVPDFAPGPQLPWGAQLVPGALIRCLLAAVCSKKLGDTEVAEVQGECGLLCGTFDPDHQPGWATPNSVDAKTPEDMCVQPCR